MGRLETERGTDEWCDAFRCPGRLEGELDLRFLDPFDTEDCLLASSTI